MPLLDEYMAAFKRVNESFLQHAPQLSAVVRVHARDCCNVTAQNGEFQNEFTGSEQFSSQQKARRQLSTLFV